MGTLRTPPRPGIGETAKGLWGSGYIPGLVNRGSIMSGLRFWWPIPPPLTAFREDMRSTPRRQSAAEPSSSSESSTFLSAPLLDSWPEAVRELAENRPGCTSPVGEWVSRGEKWKREEAVGTGGALWGTTPVEMEKTKGSIGGLVCSLLLSFLLVLQQHETNNSNGPNPTVPYLPSNNYSASSIQFSCRLYPAPYAVFTLLLLICNIISSLILIF